MKLNELLGVEFPIIQGGMANVATGAFAAAVSNAGALGLIGSGGMDADSLRKEIQTARAAKGVRKTHLEGYSQVNEFYQPDYRVLPPQADDYRRTLYWNPEVVPDKDGRARLRFFNNSRCSKPRITIETLTGNGQIGVLQQASR